MVTMDDGRWRRTSAYLQDVFGREDEALAALREAARAEGLPDIAVSSEVGRLVQLLTRTTRARVAVELGTLGGYSGVWIARALAPGGRLYTVELDPAHAAFARRWFDRCGVGDRVEVLEGAALDVLPGLLARLGDASVDVAFLDAVKTEYPAYLALLADRIAPAGLLLADNALGSHSWWIDHEGDPSRDAVDVFNRALAADARFDVACVPAREGVTIGRRRP